VKKYISLIIVIFLSVVIGFAQENIVLNQNMFGTGNWDADSLGNHRVVINVGEKADIIWAHIPWRRRDSNPEKKDIIIVDANSGNEIKNVFLVTINREFGDILFQPKIVGNYYVYYLKNITSGHKNYPTVTYPTFVSKAEKTWLTRAKTAAGNFSGITGAKLVQFQSINQFNSFYPMEIIATANEVATLISKNKNADYLLFPEKRENSIRMTSDIPLKWIQDGVTNSFSVKVFKNEYFTFQAGVFAIKKDIENIKVTFSGLKKGGKTVVDASAFSSFNTGGTNWEGNPLDISCSVKQNKVQPLWFGVQIPENINAGTYQGVISITPENAAATDIQLELTVLNEKIVAGGDNNPERMSRLRWLNSTLAADDDIVAPYTPLQRDSNTVKCLGRKVVFSTTGFPESIKSYFSESVTKINKTGREILASPVKFIVETDRKTEEWQNSLFKVIKEEKGAIAWEIKNEMPGLKMDGTVQMEFDGNIDYKLVLTATKDIAVKDIRLEIPVKKDAAKYMMGLGEKGGLRPEKVNWKWAVEKNQDGPWVGDVNAGFQVRFRDNNYSRPLNTNFYQKKPLVMPKSWDNNGKGGISIKPAGNNMVSVTSYSGERTIKKGEQLYFYFNFLITPFHLIETKKHWHNRYYHSFVDVDTVIAYGANTINVHHATDINPFINYPFLRPDKMKTYVDEAHKKGAKVKIYYTVREITNSAPELFMLRSLGEEVISYGNGGGFSWLQEHLDPSYIAAWFVPKLKDAAIITTGISRWHNFYVEGLNWLVKNIGIDGIYIDDLAFDRTSMKRIRKVLIRGNSGGLIDLHSANQFNPRDGFANSANLYLENFPFIDRLWFGEYFNYDFSPEFWLIEASGIPYGLMGEMLQDGGNPWRGMVFGMTSRAPWSGDPSPLWKVWDDFGIEDSEMIGFWDSSNPVATNNKNVKATVYLKNNKLLIAIGNWNPADVDIQLKIDCDKINLNKNRAKLSAPAIKDFQDRSEFKPNETITIPGGKGYLLILQ
jgi:hypothetical protein